MRRLLKAGDLVAIPIPSGKTALAHVLLASSVFKDLVLLGVFDFLFDGLKIPDPLPKSYAFEPVYTSSIGVRKLHWRVAGNRELTHEEANLSLRVTGGQVWLGDTCLRDAMPEDYQTIRQMVVFGYPYLMKKIEQCIVAIAARSGDPDDSDPERGV